MSDSKNFVAALTEEFKDDEVGQMFLSATIVSGALDVSKEPGSHLPGIHSRKGLDCCRQKGASDQMIFTQTG